MSTRHTETVSTGPVTIETIIEGDGPAIALLPSLGRDGRRDFDGVASGLAALGFRVLRPQPRGIGGSTGPMEGVSLHHLAADVAAALRGLGVDRAVLVGHAFGNFIARMTAVDHPALVRGVVLAAAAARSRAPEITAAQRIAGNPAAPREDRLAALRIAFFSPGHDPTPWLEGWHPAGQRMQAQCREDQGVKQNDWWHAGTAPMLELIPELDPFKPREKWHELRDEFDDRVTTVTIPDASHALFAEAPAATAAAIATWTRGLPA